MQNTCDHPATERVMQALLQWKRVREAKQPRPPETFRDAVIRMQDERAELHGGS